MAAAVVNSTNDRNIYWNPVERGLLSATLLLIIIASLVGNILVIIVIIRHKGMRTRTNLLLFNLALADFLASVFDMPFSLATTIRGEGHWLFDLGWLCNFTGFTTPLFLVASIHTLMFMSIHKFVTVRNPHSHWMTKRRIVVLNAAAWAWAIIASALSICGLTTVDHTDYTTQCSPKYPDDVKSYVHLALAIATCYAVPIIIIGVCSLGVWIKIRAYGRRMRESSTVDHDEIYDQQRHITVTLMLVVTAFIICWTPVVGYAIYSAVMKNEDKINHLANPITTWFGYANSVCNPIIYAFRSEAFREGYKEVIWRSKKARRLSTSSASSSNQRLQRGSTLSSTVSRNPSNALPRLNDSDYSPSAADFNSALAQRSSSSAFERDTTTTTVTTLLYDEDVRSQDGSRSSSRRHGSNRPGQSSEDHQKQMVSFSDQEELSAEHELTASDHVTRQFSTLKSYLSVEHLDDISDHHHHHHHHGDQAEDEAGSSKSRKKRKIRGPIGGLHRPRAAADAGEEMMELQSGHQLRNTSQEQQQTSNQQPVVSDLQDTNYRPIYKKAAVTSVERESSRPRAARPPLTTAQDNPSSDSDSNVTSARTARNTRRPVNGDVTDDVTERPTRSSRRAMAAIMENSRSTEI